jgi:hypothetical protein
MLQLINPLKNEHVQISTKAQAEDRQLTAVVSTMQNRIGRIWQMLEEVSFRRTVRIMTCDNEVTAMLFMLQWRGACKQARQKRMVSGPALVRNEVFRGWRPLVVNLVVCKVSYRKPFKYTYTYLCD